MTDPSKVLLLTDDEVVAIAALLGVPWPTPFTVAGRIDREVVEAMVQRGTTSLLVRELATAATGAVELGAVVRSYLDPMLAGVSRHDVPLRRRRSRQGARRDRAHAPP